MKTEFRKVLREVGYKLREQIPVTIIMIVGFIAIVGTFSSFAQRSLEELNLLKCGSEDVVYSKVKTGKKGKYTPSLSGGSFKMNYRIGSSYTEYCNGLEK